MKKIIPVLFIFTLFFTISNAQAHMGEENTGGMMGGGMMGGNFINGMPMGLTLNIFSWSYLIVILLSVIFLILGIIALVIWISKQKK